MPKSLIIHGAISLLFPLYVIWNFVAPTLGIAANLGSKNVNIWTYTPIIVLISVFIAEILIGFRYLNLQNNTGFLSSLQRKQARVLFVIGIIAGILTIPIMIYWIILPIYALTYNS